MHLSDVQSLTVLQFLELQITNSKFCQQQKVTKYGYIITS